MFIYYTGLIGFDDLYVVRLNKIAKKKSASSEGSIMSGRHTN